MPERIQRRRTPGWRMPDGVVYVGRPGKWGNPFSELQIGEAYPSLTETQVHSLAVQQFRDLVRADQPLTFNERPFRGGERKLVTYSYPSRAEIVAELAGRDLACWCSAAETCHADVLLEIANGEPA
ncbi:DUF4326 domain-containing protein [Mycolicibacterium sp. A43C]